MGHASLRIAGADDLSEGDVKGEEFLVSGFWFQVFGGCFLTI